ncbi:microtubule associated protein SPM1 [Toxoplasma gondii FOU]|uniref:Microtubule associated protein SPM1 n=2 Tax=Toxoplasma gondii TaxID=5811 RepID=A0A086L770_TOXGO|nr:microtubule associated protein SPM1 [Toxoplasma gondii FOU]PUA89934.1 microtubule associated protein SPM1 [Toxoplasma gondii TgCATBr9]
MSGGNSNTPKKLPSEEGSDYGYPQKPQKYLPKSEQAEPDYSACCKGNDAYKGASHGTVQFSHPEEAQKYAGAAAGAETIQRGRERVAADKQPPAAGDVPARRLHLSDVDEAHRGQSPSRHPGYCVEELCTCGMHKCIPSRAPVPFTGSTQYRQEFVPKPLPPPTQVSQVTLPPSLPFEAESSYRTEFVAKPLPPPAKFSEVKLPPTLPFHGESAYRTDYVPKPLPEVAKPVEVKLPPTLPFNAQSCYRSEYVAKPLPPPVQTVEVKLPPSLPFEGSTHYRDEFQVKPLPPATKATEVKLPPSLPFDATSMYRSDYVAKSNPICPVSKLPQYPAATYPQNHVFWDPDTKQWY